MRELIRTLVVVGLWLAVPADLAGQGWELKYGAVETGLALQTTGEDQIPLGGGIIARVFAPNSGWFAELSWSGAWKTRPASVCHGLVLPGTCVSEPVTYSGGAAFVSAGWLHRIRVGDAMSFGLVPSFGVGALRAQESGVFTGRRYGETRPQARIGLGFEAMWSPTNGDWEIVAAASQHESWGHRSSCEDCGNILGTRASQRAWLLGVRWNVTR